MAERKVTVLNPAGYQEQLPDTDNLLVSATPTANLHAANKAYVDQKVADVDLSEIESDITAIEVRLSQAELDITTIESDIAAIETNYALKSYVDSQDSAITTAYQAADTNLQNQIDVLDARTETQTLQNVTDLGSSTTNDMTSTGTITASVLVGDIDQGTY